jgi:pre-rRNA-processing protein TSR4
VLLSSSLLEGQYKNTMWQDGHDTNEGGVPVRLYQPILYSKRAASADAKSSHVGGVPAYFDSDTVVKKETPQCAGCRQEMYLLLQLYNPDTERTLYVFGCNRGSCVASAFENSNSSSTSQFSLGGSGRFVCRHSQPDAESSDEVKDAPAAPASESPWGADDNDDADADNDWDMDDDNLDDVEAMVAAMEMKGPGMKAETSKPIHTPASTSKQSQASSSSSFPCFDIHSLQEPASRRSDDMDDDDVGMMGMTTDDKKIQEMLARYMQEEEDEEILAAIQGAGGSGSGRAGEKDERLPAEDRAMLAFTDRVKRSPRQIVRYARGGIPLWSV